MTWEEALTKCLKGEWDFNVNPEWDLHEAMETSEQIALGKIKRFKDGDKMHEVGSIEKACAVDFYSACETYLDNLIGPPLS